MPKQTVINFNLDGLDKLTKGLSKDYRARVGILGSHAVRGAGAGIDNATLGIIQMFGSLTNKIPPRDFLIMPIENHRREILQEMGKSSIKKAIASGEYKKVYALLGAAALRWVQESFETKGFGQWPPNKPSTIRRKGSAQPLIDTGELRKAQTSDVVNKSDII